MREHRVSGILQSNRERFLVALVKKIVVNLHHNLLLSHPGREPQHPRLPLVVLSLLRCAVFRFIRYGYRHRARWGRLYPKFHLPGALYSAARANRQYRRRACGATCCTNRRCRHRIVVNQPQRIAVHLQLGCARHGSGHIHRFVVLVETVILRCQFERSLAFNRSRGNLQQQRSHCLIVPAPGGRTVSHRQPYGCALIPRPRIQRRPYGYRGFFGTFPNADRPQREIDPRGRDIGVYYSHRHAICRRN